MKLNIVVPEKKSDYKVVDGREFNEMDVSKLKIPTPLRYGVVVENGVEMEEMMYPNHSALVEAMKLKIASPDVKHKVLKVGELVTSVKEGDLVSINSTAIHRGQMLYGGKVLVFQEGDLLVKW